MSSLFDALYNRLLLRDVLGKMVPGSILLASLYLAFLSDAPNLTAAAPLIANARWPYWLATGLLGWFTAFAIQAMGG